MYSVVCPIFYPILDILAKVMCMTLIPCTDLCIYQRDGRCTLSRAGSGGQPEGGSGCVHFLPHQPSQQDRQGFPDISYRDEL